MSYKRYNMHKYWGKKPAEGLLPLIKEYSKEGDTVLDPFSGYGVFCCEAFLANRSVVSNDLNPAANFITRVLMSEDINLTKVKELWLKIHHRLEDYIRQWYIITIDGVDYYPISVLRTHEDLPVAISYKSGHETKTLDIPLSIAEDYLEKEQNAVIEDWFPRTALIQNSRISAQVGKCVPDLFTKRTLACHARLYALINEYASGGEKDLLLMAFTANLANCSKLVPPISSRGKLAQGAWMTGFYIGESYIENNVLHYFENRLNKAISGKQEYYQLLKESKKTEIQRSYSITNDEAQRLAIPDESIDYVFTDPPYGDTVPYFEQSIIWNSWLGFQPSYDEEIVISDSSERQKDIDDYSREMDQSISEISRVLKKDHFFSITYHSLSGKEWRAITNACLQHGFVMEKFTWLEQKTLPPRQLARQKTIKGDVLVTFKKSHKRIANREYSEEEFQNHLHALIDNCIETHDCNTNELMMSIMKWVLSERIIINNTDVYEYLNNNYSINQQGIWEEL